MSEDITLGEFDEGLLDKEIFEKRVPDKSSDPVNETKSWGSSGISIIPLISEVEVGAPSSIW